jgi:hypothetical protein
MAKESGLSWSTLSIDNGAGVAKDIRNDFTNFEFSTPRGVQETTGVDKAATERLLLLADFSFTGSGVFNDAADMSHEVLKTIPSTSVERTVALGVSGQTLSVECLFSDYALTRAANGELTWTTAANLSNGAVPTWS